MVPGYVERVSLGVNVRCGLGFSLETQDLNLPSGDGVVNRGGGSSHCDGLNSTNMTRKARLYRIRQEPSLNDEKSGLRVKMEGRVDASGMDLLNRPATSSPSSWRM